MVAVTLAGVALGLAGCGEEDATDPGAGGADPAASEPANDDTPELGSEHDDDGQGDIGSVLVNERLAISPAEYPLPGVPTHVEVANADELRVAFATVPGIDDIVAQIEDDANAAGRMFAYTTNACITDDVSLEVRGNEVPMIVNGTATIRCEPPTTLVVWAVGDQVPSAAVPAQAIQK